MGFECRILLAAKIAIKMPSFVSVREDARRQSRPSTSMTHPEVHFARLARLTAVLVHLSETSLPNRLSSLLITALPSIYAAVQQGYPD